MDSLTTQLVQSMNDLNEMIAQIRTTEISINQMPSTYITSTMKDSISEMKTSALLLAEKTNLAAIEQLRTLSQKIDSISSN